MMRSLYKNAWISRNLIYRSDKLLIDIPREIVFSLFLNIVLIRSITYKKIHIFHMGNNLHVWFKRSNSQSKSY